MTPKSLELKTIFKKYGLIWGFIATLILTAGTFFTNGFPPYNLAILVILLALHNTEKDSGLNSKLLTTSAAIFCLILITPAPVAFLLLPALVLLTNVVKVELVKRNYTKLISTIVVICILAFLGMYSFSGSSATLGWRQILAPGGVNQPNTQLMILFLLAYPIFVSLNFSKMRKDFLFLTTISGTASMAILTSLNLAFTGQVQYYSVKQFYVWLALISLLIYRYLMTEAVEFQNFRSRFTYISFITIPIFSILLSLTMSNGFMQNLPNSFVAILNRQSATTYVVDGFKHVQLSMLDPIPDNTCILYRVGIEESDLNSRWANALSNPIFMPENCFGVYWNSTAMTLEEITSRAKENNNPFLFVLSTNNPPKFLEVLEKNDYFLIAKTGDD